MTTLQREFGITISTFTNSLANLNISHFLLLTASIFEIDKNISEFQDVLSSLPKSHPDHFGWLCILAMAQFRRHRMFHDERDLDKSILRFTQAIFHPFHTVTKDGPNLITAFFFLTDALLRRTLMSRQPVAGNIKYCIKYFYYLRDLSLEDFGVSRDEVTELLMYALSLQIRQGSADVKTSSKQMTVLCQELLTSDDLTVYPVRAIQTFASIVRSLVGLESDTQFSEQLIECLREANVRLPDSHDVPYALSWCLFMRFDATKSNDDCDDAIVILDKIVASHSSADDPDLRSRAQEAARLAATLAHGRSTLYQKPEYLEEALFRRRAHLSTLPLEYPDRHTFFQIVTDLERKRFDEFGIKGTDSEACFHDPEVIDLPSFSNLAASLVNNSSAVHLTIQDKDQHLHALMSMNHITDIADLEEAIKYAQVLLSSLPPVDQLAHLTAANLGQLRYLVFTRTDDVEHLNESITAYRDLLSMPGAQGMHFHSIRLLVSALSSRFELFKDVKDLEEMIRLFAVAVNDSCAKVPSRFEVACEWASLARPFRHPSVTIAYESAFSLMQDSLVYAPTLEIQHFRLVRTDVKYKKLPLDCASHQIHRGQFKQAVETLERGRGLLFSEMRGLRTSLDQLRAVDTPLAEKFANINRELETLTTTSVSPGVPLNSSGAGGHDKMDPFGCLVKKQRKLTEERERLILHIRTLSGFERFLMAPSFHTLRSAAVRGPVIIINHNQWRSDIIILLHDSPPSLISTPDHFYGNAEALRDVLLTARKQGLDSMAYQEALSSILKDLYDLVGRPVIQRLHELDVPEQSRIWFCPTSVFCYLPLHAMGPIPSDMGPPQYFLDLYIPSYTPSLSALIESHKPSSKISDKPSILLVIQPDAFMVQALKEMQALQAICPQATTLIGTTATPPGVLERLQNHRFVHIVSHGVLESGKPFNSCFKLHNGKQLSLLDIVRSQLPHAEFAFLAACHTAEMTDESPSDEALHLAAAMQYCGFRSVVGTMWAMADTDGQDLAGNFYTSLFSGRRKGVHYYERTAEALRDAVVKLRRRRGREMSLERWVNYVHYGA
jgi:CHAT domain-containing protein